MNTTTNTTPRTALQATTAFYQASRGVRLFRLGLKASQWLWPALAVRAAHRLFGTPLPPKWLSRGAAWGREWRLEQWPFEDANLTIYSPAVAPHGPVVLLLHG